MRTHRFFWAGALALALAFGMTGCSSSNTQAQSSELVGKPWVTSVLAGNLPAEQPAAKDDLYTHYAYDYLADHQATGGSAMEERSVELQTSVTDAIKDHSKTSHDLEQLRMFYDQAADAETLKETGLAEIQPYLDRIDAAQSLDDLNALIAANDFPFSPFIQAAVKTNDTRATNIVGVVPNFLFCDPLLTGGTYYQETDDPTAQEAAQSVIQSAAIYPLADFVTLGMSDDEARAAIKQLIDFEKQHGKFLEGNDTYLKQDFDALAKAARENVFTLDELCALCPNYPMDETLAKMEKDGSEKYNVTRAWLEAFNGLWTESNLDTLKLMAKAKVLDETRAYRDHSGLNALLAQFGLPTVDDESAAWKACDNINTFAQVLAKTYVEECLPANAEQRLTILSEQLIDEWKDLVDDTTWMNEESRQRVVEKLDHMTLNVLEPKGGYFDYSALELTPSDQGGTLFSNYLKLKRYRYDREAELVGHPAVAASPWFSIAPTTMNAYYDCESNSINILPGYISSLTYADSMTEEELLANMGITIGHEISHGFDYQGAQMDAYGQPNPVLTDADIDKFVTLTSALAFYYSGIELEPGMMANGQVVAGEAAADLAGVQVALEIAGKSADFDFAKFFDAFSNAWAQVLTADKFAASATDTHPLSNLRVNVTAQMFHPIYDKLGVAEGDGMYLAPEQRIAIWGPNAQWQDGDRGTNAVDERSATTK